MVTCVRLPKSVGDAVTAVEPLRHGVGNAATTGIWRVRGTAGTAVLKLARLPAAADPAKAFPASDAPDHWNYWRREALGYETGLGATAYAWDHPSVAVWPAGVRRRLRQLWADQGRLTAIADAAERTLCHLDVWPANLIDGAGTSVLLDWSFTGDGAVGEDVANLIIDSCTDGLMDVALLPEIAESATDGYLGGLRDGGWTGSADAVRTTIGASGAAKYSWFAPAVAGRAARDHIGQSSYGQDTSATAAARRVTGLVTLIADWAEAGHG